MSNKHLPVLTNSQMKMYRRCQKEAYLGYELGYRAVVEAEALRFGSLAHLGLEGWWLAAKSGADRLEAALLAMVGEADPFDLARAQEMLRGYHARWLDEPLEVIVVECEFRAPLINPESNAPSRTFQLGGKLDVIVRDLRDGRVYKAEHKTSSEDIGVGSSYWKRLTLDPQISTYYAGARELGFDVAGCIYDVLAKPGQRPLKATPEESRKYTKDGRLYANQRAVDETPEEYAARLREAIAEAPDKFYQRGVVVRLESEERDAAFDRWQIARAYRESQLAGRWPRNPDSCVRWNRECCFFPVCTGTASIEDPTLFRRAEKIHEELSDGAAAA